MTNGVSVTSQGKSEYRITWPQAVKFDWKTLLLACLHQIRVLSQEESEDQVIGVEGERERLLSWLRSLEIVDEENMKRYEQAMTASLHSGPEHPQKKIAEHPPETAQRHAGKSRRRNKR